MIDFLFYVRLHDVLVEASLLSGEWFFYIIIYTGGQVGALVRILTNSHVQTNISCKIMNLEVTCVQN